MLAFVGNKICLCFFAVLLLC